MNSETHSCHNHLQLGNRIFDGFQYIETYRCQFEVTETETCDVVIEDIYKTEVSNLTHCKENGETFHSFKDSIPNDLSKLSLQKTDDNEDKQLKNRVVSKQTKKWIVFLRTCQDCNETVRITYKYSFET